MRGKIMNAYFTGKKAVKNFLKEEKGAADIVAILVVIIIIIAVAAIFRTQLLEFVNQVMEDLLAF